MEVNELLRVVTLRKGKLKPAEFELREGEKGLSLFAYRDQPGPAEIIEAVRAMGKQGDLAVAVISAHEIRALGSRVLPCLHRHRPWVYACEFARILREHGPYDIVHAHTAHYCGIVLRLARRAGVPGRVFHVHSDMAAVKAQAGLVRRLYMAMMDRWIDRYATTGLAQKEQELGPTDRPNGSFRVCHPAADRSIPILSVAATQRRPDSSIPDVRSAKSPRRAGVTSIPPTPAAPS